MGVGSRLYCHIGMQKAGSKAIQHFSVDNKAALKAHGFNYPRALEPGVWHRKLFTEFDDAREAALAEVMARSETVVLSFERAYLVSERTIARLAALASEMHVFFVVREPVSWLNSWINQLAKAHRSDYRRYLDQNHDSPAIGEALSIDKVLARWEGFAGRDQITAVEYEAYQDVLSPYMDWLGIADGERAGLATNGGDPNRALDGRGFRVCVAVKRLADGADASTLGRIMKRAHARLEALPPEDDAPFRLVDDALAARIKTKYQPGFDEVMARYGRPDRPATRFAETRAALMARRVLAPIEPSAADVALAEEIVAG